MRWSSILSSLTASDLKGTTVEGVKRLRSERTFNSLADNNSPACSECSKSASASSCWPSTNCRRSSKSRTRSTKTSTTSLRPSSCTQSCCSNSDRREDVATRDNLVSSTSLMVSMMNLLSTPTGGTSHDGGQYFNESQRLLSNLCITEMRPLTE